MPEQQQVQPGDRRAVGGALGQLLGVPGGGVLGLGERPVGRRHGVHPVGRARRPRSSSARRAPLLVALVVVGRDEALVAPPDVDRGPVDRPRARARRPARPPARRTAVPIPPPVSTTDAVPCTACAAASRATSAAATARASWSASGSTTTSGRRPSRQLLGDPLAGREAHDASLPTGRLAAGSGSSTPCWATSSVPASHRARWGRAVARVGSPRLGAVAVRSAGSNHTCSRTGERSASPEAPVAASSASL